MKLEAGKKYVLVSGQVVGPLFDEVQDCGKIIKYMSNDMVDSFSPVWDEDGSADFFFWSKNFPEHNILAEYVELM